MVDRETGSHWNTPGEALDGPLAGRRLVPVPGVARARLAFRPDTRIHRGGADE